MALMVDEEKLIKLLRDFVKKYDLYHMYCADGIRTDLKYIVQKCKESP